MIPDSFLQELRYRCDISDIISSYVVLKRRGRVLVGLCPFHSEKTPSFTVYPDSQSFYCFGCGSGGDVITFIKRIENLEYVEAVKFLADKAGLTVPDDGFDDKTVKLKQRILQINRDAARFYFQCLISKEGQVALDYFKNRRLTAKTIKRFGLGYAPNRWDGLLTHLRQKGYTDEELLASKVILRGKNGNCYDAFRNRVIFPIIDIRGNVIAFGGRVLDDSLPKYLNSPDTLVFKKSRNLFAMNIAKSSKADHLILAEGYMDVIALHQAGFDQAVATLGTSLTTDQAKMISNYTQKVIISYDSDNAGRTAAKRAIGIFDDTGVNVRVLAIKDAKDPDEYIKKFGPTRFQMLLDGCENALEFEVQNLKNKYDITTTDGKIGFLKEFSEFIATVKNKIEREIYLSKIAQEVGIEKTALTAQVDGIIKRRMRKAQKKQAADLRSFVAKEKTTYSPQALQNTKCVIAEDRIITALIKQPEYRAQIMQTLQESHFVVPENAAVFRLIRQRLQDGYEVDLIHLSPFLTEEEMSKLSGVLAASSQTGFTEEAVADYLNTLLQEHAKKTKEEIAQMEEDELRAYINSIAASKK